MKQGDIWTFINLQGASITTEEFAVAGDFHEGRARVGFELETARRRIADVDADAKDRKPPRFMPNWPPMIAEGGDMRNGITSIKLVSGGYYDNYLIALLNKRGELVIPALMPPRPPANASGVK